MPTDPKLEQYLTALDRALGQIPVSDRCDIVTEIKSHILEARDRDPDQDIGTILTSIGEPETVANRYLLERGLKPGRPSKSPIVKWLTIGFLGTFGIIALSLLVLLWKFTPILKVDEQTGHVQILGGMIEVNNADGVIDFKGGTTFHRIAGAVPADAKTIDRIHISFKSAKVEFLPSKTPNFRWKCKVEHPKTGAPTTLKERTLTFDLEDAGGAKCEFRIPAGIATRVDGTNGKIQFIRPRGDVEVNLVNGALGIEPDGKENYRYALNVKNGLIDSFTPSEAKDAHMIKATIVNGKIAKTETDDDASDSE
jgi:hypothetical protein